jgi:hypothetical protein
MIENKLDHLGRSMTFMQVLVRAVMTLLFLISGSAVAGDLTALSWEDNAGVQSLQVWVSGSPAYEIQTLDGGQRLRLRLSDTTLRDVTDVEGRGVVKGVYPYLSDTGTGVNIDFLLTQPGQLKVEPATYGYRVLAQVSGAEAAPTAVEESATKAATPPAAPVAPAAECDRGDCLRQAPG